MAFLKKILHAANKPHSNLHLLYQGVYMHPFFYWIHYNCSIVQKSTCAKLNWVHVGLILRMGGKPCNPIAHWSHLSHGWLCLHCEHLQLQILWCHYVNDQHAKYNSVRVWLNAYNTQGNALHTRLIYHSLSLNREVHVFSYPRTRLQCPMLKEGK